MDLFELPCLEFVEFCVFKEKTNLSTKNSISGKVVLNSEGEIKTFPDKEKLKEFINTQFTSVTQSCPNLCNPMECTTPGFPVPHQLPELAQNHVH